MPVLSINNLHVSYGAIRALHGVNLHVDRGEIVALIGSNGAGKTTLLRTISGLLRPGEGTIVWNGGDGPAALHDMPAHEIVRLGICHVPEGRQVFANLTVRENLLLGGYTRRHSEAAPIIERCFGLFPVLADRQRQKAGTLSGGEQQMLAISRALMASPQLLLLDEPSLGLAPKIVGDIFQIIRKINQEGTTVLLVEQNANKALAAAHRGYVLQTGVVSKEGPAADLLKDPEVKRLYLGG
jgi:branched-chain amino acid transport system ATP-binding protein